MLAIRSGLIDCEIAEDASKFSFHPTYVKLFLLWQSYIQTETENSKMYDELKKTFIECFGEANYSWMLHNTYFFHRTKYMQLKNLVDTFERIEQ